MKKFIYYFIFIFILFSCEKVEDVPETKNDSEVITDEETIDEQQEVIDEQQEVIDDGETTVEYQEISRNDFQNMKNKGKYLVKAKITKISKGWAWGTEVSLEDLKGNSSTKLYDHSIYGMFSFPINTPDFDAQLLNGKTFVFIIYNDVYMSSFQLGFGGLKISCYDGRKWTCNYTYGIEYFDDIIRGNLKSISFEENKGIKIIVGNNNIIYFKELKSEDISKITPFLKKNIFVRVIKNNSSFESILDNNGNIQISEKI